MSLQYLKTMKNILICVTLSIICLSCEKKINDENNNTTLQNVALKLFFTNIEDESPYKIQKYNYDSEHRLETIIHYPGDTLEQALIREFYEYSPNDVLINRYGYHYVDDSIGWQLNDSTHYQYENNNLHVEEIYFSSSWTTPAISCESKARAFSRLSNIPTKSMIKPDDFFLPFSSS